ncbi:hypothetical protein DSO57_1023406 [Entomophthora muscae]|uniref:Uncharacterized protein n=1 Tax=Entomophthora muscae TaxID=34485 RepID=A0ACC2U181_9FUNG|nr:hypothetical protein DSO57_1023406 [Entomophthora muscae]
MQHARVHQGIQAAFRSAVPQYQRQVRATVGGLRQARASRHEGVTDLPLHPLPEILHQQQRDGLPHNQVPPPEMVLWPRRVCQIQLLLSKMPLRHPGERYPQVSPAQFSPQPLP